MIRRVLRSSPLVARSMYEAERRRRIAAETARDEARLLVKTDRDRAAVRTQRAIDDALVEDRKRTYYDFGNAIWRYEVDGVTPGEPFTIVDGLRVYLSTWLVDPRRR